MGAAAAQVRMQRLAHLLLVGVRMRAQALLERNASPSATEIRQHMSANLCRCGTHMRILRAIERAADLIRSAGTSDEKPRPA